MSRTVYMPGPLYPDLFNGATPIMMPTEFEDLDDIKADVIRRLRDAVIAEEITIYAKTQAIAA